VRRSLIVDTTVHVVFHSVLVLSVYLLFAGHNQPGGGFAGGLVAGAAVGLRYVAGGIDAVRAASPVRAWTILGSGLLVAAVTAAAPLLLGEPALHSAQADWHLPLLGDAHVTTATIFDTGVYLVVVGLVLMVFEAFGDDPEADPIVDAADEGPDDGDAEDDRADERLLRVPGWPTPDGGPR
jgi:multicomponent Na+:H+ antiporter subunit A